MEHHGIEGNFSGNHRYSAFTGGIMGAVGFMYPPIENQYFSCHIYLMIITQTVYIQADRRIFLDLPPELPVGKAKVAVIPQIEKPIDSTYEATVKPRGLAKKMGSTLRWSVFLK